MKPVTLSLVSLASAIALSTTVAAAENHPKVVVSIKPIHSLVATVMQGVGKPDLIVDGAGSPHTYALKPSQAAALQKADLVFWIAHELEAFLEKPIKSIPRNAVAIELMEAPGVKTLELREGGPFDAHDHDHGESHGHEDEHEHEKEHDHDEKDEHADEHDHDKKDEHVDEHDHDKKDEHADKDDHDHKAEKEHDHEDEHGHHEVDAHIWLDPVNAKALIGVIKDALVKADPAHRKTYEANAAAANDTFSDLIREVTATLAPVKERKFVVFHDAYQYFEKRFGVTAAGSITVSPEVMPGAARLEEIRARLKTLGATCVFAEPQFEPKLVSVVIEGSAAHAGVLDPLGAEIEAGPELYPTLIRNMAGSIAGCLSKS